MESPGNGPWVKEDGGPCRRFVAYYRVSTRAQGRSGLGLEAQQAAVSRFLQSNSGDLFAEFTEVESGTKAARPQFNEALRLCRIFSAVLVIAKLDRLARNFALIAQLMESGVEFVAADFPQANQLTIHILAAIAEYEAKLISERVKAAIVASKARGVVWGGNRNAPTAHLGAIQSRTLLFSNHVPSKSSWVMGCPSRRVAFSNVPARQKVNSGRWRFREAFRQFAPLIYARLRLPVVPMMPAPMMPMVPTPVVPAPVTPIHGLDVSGRDGALKRGRSEREWGRRGKCRYQRRRLQQRRRL